MSANHLTDESAARETTQDSYVQMDLFTDYEALAEQKQKEDASLRKERAIQEAILSVKKKYGKNAILKGMNLEKGATAMERNHQIGGHKA